MPTIDSLSKELFRDSHVFADAINGHFFHGEQVVKPESLSDMDPTEFVLPNTAGTDVTQECAGGFAEAPDIQISTSYVFQ